MKGNRFSVTLKLFQHLLMGFGFFFSASSANSQGELLLNNSFEQPKPLVSYPNFCLPYVSGSGSNAHCVTIADYFSRVANWTSYYSPDGDACNLVSESEGPGYDVPWWLYTEWAWYVHSPDLVSNVAGIDFCGEDCVGGWNSAYSVGMQSYEVIWQNFVGDNNTKRLDINKSYEVRIKVRFIPQAGGISDQIFRYLDVLLGTYPFHYINGLEGLQVPEDVLLPDHGCSVCNLNFRTYSIGLTDDIRNIKRFRIPDLTDLINVYPNPYFDTHAGDPFVDYNYDSWFEFHAKMKMSDYDFTNPLFPIKEFVNFGLDIREPEPNPDANIDNCDGPYLQIDQIEFFESCPNNYEIYGAMIAGEQDAYVASDHITAGLIDEPAIVTLNGKTEFVAGHYVDLVPGFLADKGSVLGVYAIQDMPDDFCKHYKSQTIEQNANLNSFEQNNKGIRPIGNNDVSIQILRIFPNPSTGIFNVVCSRGLILSISILDNMSKTINFIGNINKNEYQVDITNLESGVYCVMVQTNENGTFNKQLVKL